MGVNVAGSCSCGCLTQHRTAAALQTRRKIEQSSACWKYIFSQKNLVHSKLKLLLQIVSFENFSDYSVEMGNGFHKEQVRALYHPQNGTKSCPFPRMDQDVRRNRRGKMGFKDIEEEQEVKSTATECPKRAALKNHLLNKSEISLCDWYGRDFPSEMFI